MVRQETMAYGDSAASNPPFLYPAEYRVDLGHQGARRRVIAGRARDYRSGLRALSPGVRIREMVWSGDGSAVAEGDSVVHVVTPWVPTRLLRGSILCDVPHRYAPSHIRLEAQMALRGPDILAMVWVEGKESERCMGTASAEDRLVGFLDDLEMHVRDVSRRGRPVPIRNP